MDETYNDFEKLKLIVERKNMINPQIQAKAIQFIFEYCL